MTSRRFKSIFGSIVMVLLGCVGAQAADVAVFFGDYTQKFKLKGCYIEKVLELCTQKHMKYENGAFGFRYFLRRQPVGCAS